MLLQQHNSPHCIQPHACVETACVPPQVPPRGPHCISTHLLIEQYHDDPCLACGTTADVASTA
jgi:hypothetical protein